MVVFDIEPYNNGRLSVGYLHPSQRSEGHPSLGNVVTEIPFPGESLQQRLTSLGLRISGGENVFPASAQPVTFGLPAYLATSWCRNVSTHAWTPSQTGTWPTAAINLRQLKFCIPLS
jgi:hypothetical protein